MPDLLLFTSYFLSGLTLFIVLVQAYVNMTLCGIVLYCRTLMLK